MKRILWKAGALATVLSLVGVTVALAASGDLDPLFSGDGKVTTDFASSWSDDARDVALQANNKIVVAGYRFDPDHPSADTRNFAVARYNTNGTLDTNFNADGKRGIDLGGLDEAWDVAIQPDGKIVLAGSKCDSTFTLCDLAVVRLESNGNLDGGFGVAGKRIMDFGTKDNGTFGGLVIQPDGKILIAGYMYSSNKDYDFAVYRLNADGTDDASFSGDGRERIAFGAGRQDRATDLVLQGANIVVGGSSCNAAYDNCNFALARLTPSGALDNTFSGDGKQTTDFGNSDLIYGLSLQTDGKIVAVGETTDDADYEEMAIARYKVNGGADTTFSTDGKRTLAIGDKSWAQAVIAQANGKIAVAGASCDTNGNNCNFAMARFKSNGPLNLGFSTDGKATYDFGNTESVQGMAQNPTNFKYLLVGTTWDGNDDDFAVARVLP